MRTLTAITSITIMAVLLITMAVTNIAKADVYVRGHYRSNGSYVQPHYRSNPDGIRSNNWSARGNVNPYTGKVGTRRYGAGNLSNIEFLENKPTNLPYTWEMIENNGMMR